MSAVFPVLASESSVALVSGPDAILLLLLFLFATWGAIRGTLRQLLSIVVLGGALFAAGPLAPHIEPTVAKVAGLASGERLAAAWGVAFVCVLVLGAILVAFLAHRLRPRSRGGWDRVFGALLGAAKGACVLLIVGYALLGGLGRRDAPSLSRPTPSVTVRSAPPLVGAVRGSTSARWLAAGADLLLHLLALPPWIHDRVDAVNRRLAVHPPVAGSGGVRRPRTP